MPPTAQGRWLAHGASVPKTPSPTAWDRVYKRLLDWHRTHALGGEDKPSVPLILAGRGFSSSSLRHDRWLQTVDWAQRHGCADLVAVGSDDFDVFDGDISAAPPGASAARSLRLVPRGKHLPPLVHVQDRNALKEPLLALVVVRRLGRWPVERAISHVDPRLFT